MKTLFKLSTLFIFLSFLLSTQVSAVANTIEPILLADVNIQDAKIVSQKDNTFNISFTFTNGQGLQTGVKYGIELRKQTDKGQFLVDEKIYDESLTLNANSVTKKDISYIAPGAISGDYTLTLVSNNESGFPFSFATLGKVKLIPVIDGIQILPETCNLNILNKVGNPSYTLTQGVEVKPSETLSLTCTALNSEKKDISVTPIFETHYRSSYGPVVTTSTPDSTPIPFKAGEKKAFTVSIPKITTPQAYNVTFRLDSGNPVSIQYFISGAIATIQTASLDKDYYTKGEEAKFSIIYSSSESTTANIQILNDSKKSCIDTQTKTLDSSLPKVDITIPIISDCYNPNIRLTLTDTKGQTLDQKQFDVRTTSFTPTNNPMNLYIIIIIVLLIIILIYFIMRKKKTQVLNVPTAMLLFLIALSVFIPNTKAHAYSISVDTHIIASGSVGGISDPGNNASTWTGASTVYPGTGLSVSARLYRTDTGVNSDAGYLDASRATTTRSIVGSTSRIYSFGSENGGTVIASTINNNPEMVLLSIGFYCSQSEIPGCSGTYKYVTYGIPYSVKPSPTVVVSGNGIPNATSVPYNTPVSITWVSQNAISCTCSYGGSSCTPQGTGASNSSGSVVSAPGNPYTMTATKTFTVTCQN